MFPLGFFIQQNSHTLHRIFNQVMGIVVHLDFTDIPSIQLIQLVHGILQNGQGILVDNLGFPLHNTDLLALEIDIVGFLFDHSSDHTGLELIARQGRDQIIDFGRFFLKNRLQILNLTLEIHNLLIGLLYLVQP